MNDLILAIGWVVGTIALCIGVFHWMFQRDMSDLYNTLAWILNNMKAFDDRLKALEDKKIKVKKISKKEDK